MGDSVNRAARLMLVEGAGVLTDIATFSASADKFEFKERELLKVKGSDEKIRVYEPIRPAKLSQDGIVNGVNVEFTGRPTQKRQLVDALFQKSIVFVSGMEGFGKSRFLSYTAGCAEKLGFAAFSTSGSEHRSSTAYFIIGELLKQILRLNTDIYQGLDQPGKYNYIERQLEYVVETFLAPLLGNNTSFGAGGFTTLGGLDENGPARGFDHRKSSVESIGPLASSGGVGVFSSSSNLSAAAKILSIGEHLEENDSISEGRSTDDSETNPASERIQRVNSLGRMSSGRDMRSRSNSVTSISRASSFKKFLTNEGVSSNGTILPSSLEKHRRPRMPSAPMTENEFRGSSFSLFGGFAGSAKIEPMALTPNAAGGVGGCFDENASQLSGTGTEVGSIISSMTSFNDIGKKKEKNYFQLEMIDFLCLIQSMVDIGITAPLTSNIQEMSSVVRATTLDKLFYYLLSAQRNAVFIIDDAHHLDSNSWTLLDKVARRSNHISVFFSGKKTKLLSAPKMKRMFGSPKMKTIELGPLDEDSLEAMTSAMCKGGKWPKRLLKIILESTYGVPHQCAKLIEALLRASLVKVVKEGGKDGAPALLQFAEDKVIIEMVTSFARGAETRVVEQFDNLDTMCKTMVKIASVFGSYFTVEMITELLPFVLRTDNKKITSSFASLCSSDWFRLDSMADRKKVNQGGASTKEIFEAILKNKGTKTFSFSDERSRKTAYGFIPKVEIITLHNEVADCIRSIWFDDLQAVFPMLAKHYKHGENKEEEIKALQMAAAGFVRTGHLEQAIECYERMLVLAEIVNFVQFENFDKGETLAEWNFDQAICKYMIGEFDMVKKALNTSLQWLQISNKHKVNLNSSMGKKDLNKIFVSLGKTLFMKAPAAKVSVKNDKLSSISIKTMGFLFVMSLMDNNEDEVVLYGVHLLKELLECNNEQGNYAAVVICHVMRRYAKGLISKKACNFVCSKMETVFGNQMWFRESSFAVICLLLSHDFYGKDVEWSKKLADEVLEKFQNMGSVVGHSEALMLAKSIEIMVSDKPAVQSHCVAFKTITGTVKNPVCLVWEAMCRCRKFQVGSILFEANEYEEVSHALKTVRKVLRMKREDNEAEEGGETKGAPIDKLPKSVQIQAYMVEATCVLFLGESEAEFWDISFESCAKAAKIMEECTFLTGANLDSFLGVASVLLYLYKEINNPENTGEGENNAEKKKAETIKILGRVVSSCSRVTRDCCPALKAFSVALEELWKVVEGKTSVAAARGRLLKYKGELEGVCSYYWTLLDSFEGELEVFASGS